VAEEGEVFRKGTVLLGPAEMEGEYAGEELRKEVSKILKLREPKSDCSL
jgi:protein phosphatase 1 regulatory subunit 37